MSTQVTEQQVIAVHLGNIQQAPNYTIFSGFMAALRDARKFTKRDQDTGVKRVEDTCGDHGSWLGAIGYLTLLDQIGSCFKPKGVATIEGNAITKALRYFGGVSELESDAIYALRCSLAHDFGAFNVHTKKPSLTHLFTLCQGKTYPVVTFPKIPWDGITLALTNDNATWVNLEALGDLVEEIYQELLRLAASSQLEIVLKGGAKELAIKYTYWAPKGL